MEVKDGEYFYAPHRSMWGVWKRGETDANGSHGDTFIADFSTKVQAKDFVYKANHWL